MTQDSNGERASAGLAALLDELRARGTVPAGIRGRLYSILDGLRAARAPASRVQAAERIALTVHGLEWARLRNEGDEEEALWRQLDAQISELTGGGDAVRRIEF